MEIQSSPEVSLELKEQPKIKSKKEPRGARLAPYQFKKGQSGNPMGRPPGRSLKDRAKAYLAGLSDDEAVDYFEGMNKKDVWEMAEGKAKQDLEHSGVVTISHVLDSLEDDSRQETTEQGVADEPSVQDQEQTPTISEIQSEQGPSTLQPEQVVAQPNPEIPPVGVYNG